MCPIGIHWHVKESYKEYWRVKITITNYNFVKNYSDWTLVVQHPNLQSLTQLFSFNYHPLGQYGNISKLNEPKARYFLLIHVENYLQVTLSCIACILLSADDTGMFWGIKYYNDMLLSTGKNGNVQTEMVLHKDEGVFTFREGWTFPRRISFNGDECVMPSPDEYPRLPNRAHRAAASRPSIVVFASLLILAAL